MYNLSKDYEKLYELICQGHQPVCYVDYKYWNDNNDTKTCRDVCDARKRDQYTISFSIRGIEYGGVYFEGQNEKESFLKECERINLEWIDPEPKIKTLKGWEESNLNLDKYLTEPCEIDEELSLYIGECVPPNYIGFENGLIQGGDPEKHECAENSVSLIGYYMTTKQIGLRHFYLGVLPEFKK